MELKNLNCPNCGGPVQVSSNRTPFNCQHCGSALVVREEAGVSLLELSDKIASLIEGGNQEILSAIHSTSKDATSTRLYQSQLEQELTALSVQLVPLKSEFSTLRSLKQDANIVRRIQTISLQIYMLLERTRLLRGKLNEIQDTKKPLLDQLYEQYQYIQSELSYLTCAGNSSDVPQFKASLSAQYSQIEKQMVETIKTGLASSAVPQHPENDIKALSERLKIVQGDIRTVSALAVTGATQRILSDLRAKEKEIQKLIWKIQWETDQAKRQKQLEIQRAERQRQLEAQLIALHQRKDEILKQRSLTSWESFSLFIGEKSIRHLGFFINSMLLGFAIAIFAIFFLSGILLVAGIPGFIASIILGLIIFSARRIGSFFSNQIRQWWNRQHEGRMPEDLNSATEPDPLQTEAAGSDKFEKSIDPSTETLVNSESSAQVEASRASEQVQNMPLLGGDLKEAEVAAEPAENEVTSHVTSTTSESVGNRDTNPDQQSASSSSLLRADVAKRKFPWKKLALITVTILACGASSFCAFAGSVWGSQSVPTGVLARLFSLFCLGLVGLTLANLKANNPPSIARDPARGVLASIHRNQKVIGLIVISGLMITCIGTFAAISTSDLSTVQAAASTPSNVSSLQTSAVETAIMGIYRTATANIPTNTSTPEVIITSSTTLEPIEGTIIQDLSNMRSAPNLDAPILAKLGINSKVFALGSSTDKVWLLVADESGAKGWIHNSLAQFSGSLESLPVSTATGPIAMPTETP